MNRFCFQGHTANLERRIFLLTTAAPAPTSIVHHLLFSRSDTDRILLKNPSQRTAAQGRRPTKNRRRPRPSFSASVFLVFFEYDDEDDDVHMAISFVAIGSTSHLTQEGAPEWAPNWIRFLLRNPPSSLDRTQPIS